MTSRALPLLLALAGALVASTAAAQTPLPPSIAAAARAGEPGSMKKPPVKPRAKAAKPSAGAEPAKVPKAAAAAKPAAAQRGYSETLPLSRKIDRDDIADPYGGRTGGGGRMAPMMMPSGRPGMGGRF